MDTPDSWRFKMARAEKHLRDLDALIADYVALHPYRAHGTRPSKKSPTKWSFKLQVSRQPDPIIAVVLGDLLFDVRSALDHITVAIAPRKRKSKAGFPIHDADPCRPDATCEQRDNFLSMMTGMPDEALAIIKREQPYNRKHRGVEDPNGIDALSGLSALQNADKHRNLSALTLGLVDPRVSIRWPTDGISIATAAYVKAGAELVSWSDIGNRIKYDEVDVQVYGTPKVGVIVSGQGPYDLTGELSICRGNAGDLEALNGSGTTRFALRLVARIADPQLRFAHFVHHPPSRLALGTFLDVGMDGE